MEEKEKRYRQILRACGVRPTRRRILILQAITEANRPVSAAELMARHRRMGLTMDRATLYRTLNLFLEKGLVERFSSGDSSFRFGAGTRHEQAEAEKSSAHHLGRDSFRHDHPHFFCTSCGRMSCLAGDAVQVQLTAGNQALPGRALKIEVRIDGICQECCEKMEMDH